MRSRSLIGTCLALVFCLLSLGAIAQSEGTSAASPDGVSHPIAIIDQDRLLSGSRYGQRMGQEIEAAGAALVAENRRIEGQLTEEELRLTAQRASMDADAFRPLAEEFDARVESIRAAQDVKSRALQAQAETARAAFFELVFPILVDLMRMRGAAVLMDNRAVLLSAEGIDITDAAIARIDREIGDGGDAPLIDLDGTTRLPPQTEGTAP
jgi:Skp family chaperone for outer membrane proteins